MKFSKYGLQIRFCINVYWYEEQALAYEMSWNTYK